MVSKKDREIIFNKYGGKCSYCGDELQKGWHVDELLPVKRKWKWRQAGNYHKATNELVTSGWTNTNQDDYEWRSQKKIPDGMEHPERMNVDNQMPSCPSCNINKHSASLEEFRNLITGFIKSLNRDSVQYKVAKRYGLIKEEIKPIVFYFETLKPKTP